MRTNMLQAQAVASVVSLLVSGVYGSVPAFGGRSPVAQCELVLWSQLNLSEQLTLNPILRRLRNVLISVDMAAVVAR